MKNSLTLDRSSSGFGLGRLLGALDFASAHLLLGLTIGTVLASPVAAAVGATLTPSSTTGDSTTPVVLQVTGLTTGATITVERYIDANGNGIVDTGEFLAEIFTITDGQVTSIGGVRNVNVPGDEDGAANGQISVNFAPGISVELGRLAGSQLIRVSSPSSAFSAFTKTLTITQNVQSQSISGQVLNGSTAVPYASVILLDATSTDGRFIGGVISDASGHYSVNAPVGSYQIAAFKSGYVTNFGSAPVVNLAASGTPTQNVQVTAATSSISGRLTDANAPSTGLGGVQLFFQSNGGANAIANTLADGTFSVPVTADQWQIEASQIALIKLGYVPLDGGTVSADTTGGAATGVNGSLPKATALIYGTVRNSSSTPLAGIEMGANDSNNTYNAQGITDANGYYTLGVLAGSWFAYVSSSSPGLGGYVVPNSASLTLSAAQAVPANFTLTAVNAHLQGTVTNNGTPVSGVVLGAYNQSSGQFIQTTTAGNGTFDLGLVAGTWSVQLESNSAAANNLTSSTVNYTLNTNQTTSGINFVVKSSTALIMGWVRDGSSQPVVNANVYANANISGVNYFANQQTDSNGNYALPVINGTWTVGVNANSSYNNPTPVNATISGGNQVRNFTLSQTPIISSGPSNQTVNAGQTLVFSINISSGGSITYQWQVSTDSGTNWTNLANNSTYSNVTSTVLGITANVGLNGYRYRCIATNTYGSTTSSAATLTVNSTNVAPSITSHPSNQTVYAGQNTSFSVSASGTPSPTIQWQVSTDSGFNWNSLANDSTYSGVTSSTLNLTSVSTGMSGYRYRAVATNIVSPSATSNSATLTVYSPVQINTSATLPDGTVGVSYSLQLSASGAQPPYHWYLPGGTVTLPPGTMTLSDDGILSGVPSAAGTVSFSIGVGDTAWASQTTKQMSLTINSANGAPSITSQPSNQTVNAGQNTSFSVSASGTPSPTIQWQVSTDSGFNWNNLANDSTYSGVTSSTLNLTNVSTGMSGYRYRAVATNIVSPSATSNSATLTVNSVNVAPSFTSQPFDQTVIVGQGISFNVTVNGSPFPTFQWQVSTDGGAIWNNLANNSVYSGVTNPTLNLNNITAGLNGYRYRVIATNSVNSATSGVATLTVNSSVVIPGAYLVNLSVRAAIATSQTLIVGFVVDGGAKPILVRAAGPALNNYGLTGVADPRLTLYNGGGSVVTSNDDWDASLATTFATLGAFPFLTASKDAALLQSIFGPHTAQATATGAGAILVEAYDAGPNDGRKLINLSTRFFVGTGDNILIAGFVLSGTGTKQMLIRAVGPTLASYGVSGTLVDPQLAVYDGGTVIGSNDNWSSSLTPTFDTVGAFHLIDASKDAALVITLQAGKAYTAQVSGVGGATGEALIEVYAVP